MTSQKMTLALIDHYDSFTFNVIDWLSAFFDVVYVPFDQLFGNQLDAIGNLPIVVSPGPGNPDDYPQTKELISSQIGKVPVLGICLGHQLLGVMTGHSLRPHPRPFHGSCIDIRVLEGQYLFRDQPRSIQAASYNSLVIQGGAPPWVDINGYRVETQHLAFDVFEQIQASEWRIEGGFPALGVQFHPESFLTTDSDLILRDWVDVVHKFCLETRKDG